VTRRWWRLARPAVVALAVIHGSADATWAQLHAGLQSGVTISTFSGSFATDAVPVLGGTIAVDLEYWFGSHWVLDVDVGLVQRGAGGLVVDGDTIDFRINNLEIPVMLGRRLTPFGERWAVAPYVGVAVGRVSACGVRYEGEWGYGDCEETAPGGAAAAFDVSLPIGVAFRHRYPGGARISIDLRYSPSLSRTLTPGSASARHHVVQALLAFVVPLSRAGP
jgi:hypothetical protein